MMIGDQILENGAWRGFLLLVNYKNAERLVYSINHIFFFFLAKRRHTPPLATTHEYGLVYKDQENILSGFLGWPENELQVFFPSMSFAFFAASWLLDFLCCSNSGGLRLSRSSYTWYVSNPAS